MKTNNKKLTRNSFKRKVVVFGVAVFMCLAMVATGFAAWVISNDAAANGQVGVNVATISEGAIEIYLSDEDFNAPVDNVRKHKEIFQFGPVSTDTTGKVKTDNPADPTNEYMTINVSGVVTSVTYLETLTVKFSFGAELEAAKEAGYITYDATNVVLYDSTNPNSIVNQLTPIADTEEYKDAASFSFDIVIEWGAYFANVNPGYFYDGVADAEGNELELPVGFTRYADVNAIKALSVDQITTEMEDFSDMVMSTAEGGPYVGIEIVATTN